MRDKLARQRVDELERRIDKLSLDVCDLRLAVRLPLDANYNQLSPEIA